MADLELRYTEVFKEKLLLLKRKDFEGFLRILTEIDLIRQNWVRDPVVEKVYVPEGVRFRRVYIAGQKWTVVYQVIAKKKILILAGLHPPKKH
jgi:hypothetical protein